MTAPRAAIVFNATTGSDTAASGLGPASAISGTAAAHTGGSASTTITLTGSPDLSGVQAGDLLWLKTASGRQFSVIASADNSAKTVTVDDSFTIAEASAVNYAIGGKRATWNDADSRLLFSADAKAGWTIETETDQAISSAISISVAGDMTTGHIRVQGSGASRPVITQSANAEVFKWPAAYSYWWFDNLKVCCSNATKTSAYGFLNRGIGLFFTNLVVGDSTNRLVTGFQRSGGQDDIHLIDCEVCHCTADGIYAVAALDGLVEGCYVHDNGGAGIRSGSNMKIQNNLIINNTGAGIRAGATTAYYVTIRGNTIHSNDGDGIDISSGQTLVIIHGNNITANGNYGIRAASGQIGIAAFVDYNNFGTGATANTSGDRLNLNAGAHDLNVDPQYTDAANGDFSVGTNVRAKGFPDATRYIGANQSLTRSYVDIGAAQRQEAASGGGGAIILQGLGQLGVGVY